VTLAFEAHIGKKYAIYLPKAVVKALSLKEGGKVLLRVVGASIVIESVQDPIQLAIHGKKFASITPDRVEEISLAKQQSGTENPA
jgi:AbrB family looped-hinge helix DNA binding protein